MRRSDRTLLSVRSEGVPAFSRAKTKEASWTGLWLRPVSGDWTRSVVTLEDLDLSRVNRTLGDNVRSLPPEHPVSRNCAGFQLLSCFLFYHG